MDEQKQLSGLEKRRKWKKFTRVFLSTLLIFLLLGVLFFAVSEHYFIVRSVTVQETSLYPAESLIASAGIEEGTPLFSLNRKEIAKKLDEEYFFLTDVKVKLALPTGIKILFTEDTGEMTIRLGGETFLLDRELLVLARAKADDPEVPRIELRSADVKRCIVGEKLQFVDPGLEKMVLNFYSIFEEKGIIDKIGYLDFTDKFNIDVEYDSRFTVLLGENSDIAYKLSMMMKVCEELSPEDAGEIDIADPNAAYVRLYARTN